MKTLIVFSLLFSLNSSAKAVVIDPSSTDDCACTTPNLRGVPMSADGDVAKIARAVAEVDDRAGRLAKSICGTYRRGDETVESIDKIIKKFIGIQNPTPDQIALFLNKNLHKMTCSKDGKDVHYMHYSLHRESFAFFELFKNYLMDKIWMNIEDESINIDVNAVSYYGPDNTPETVLDYMVRESAKLESGDERKARIDQTIRIFVNDFNAKTYAQLQNDKDSLYEYKTN